VVQRSRCGDRDRPRRRPACPVVPGRRGALPARVGRLRGCTEPGGVDHRPLRAGRRGGPPARGLVPSDRGAGLVGSRGRGRRRAAAGAALLALGLVALAALPSANVLFLLCALALCGVGLGLALPVLSERALAGGAVLTVAARHVGLVASLALVAPILAGDLPPAGRHAELQATKLILDSPVGLTTKVPVALDLGGAFRRAKTGEIPDLRAPFDARGAGHD